MVFGFGKKEIEVTLGKYGYAPGETITGKAVLKLKKPTEARELRVELIGERTTTSIKVGGGTQHQKGRVYEFKMQLGGEGVYNTGEYNFEIKIPSDIIHIASAGGVVGEAIKTIQVLTGTYARVSWFVRAVLDRPGKKDISSKNVQIVIG
jgi:hypothetical protein